MHIISSLLFSLSISIKCNLPVAKGHIEPDTIVLSFYVVFTTQSFFFAIFNILFACLYVLFTLILYMCLSPRLQKAYKLMQVNSNLSTTTDLTNNLVASISSCLNPSTNTSAAKSTLSSATVQQLIYLIMVVFLFM